MAPLREATEPRGGCKVQGRVCVWFRSEARQKPELGFHLQLPFRSDIETQPLCFLKYLKESLLSFELLRVNMSLTPSHV